jgi:hypothetical protein
MTILTGAGTNIITVSVGPGFVGGSISVTASNICGTSPARIKAVSLNIPTMPGVISGPVTGMCGTNGAVYSIVPVPGAVSYLWTVTNGTIVGSNTGSSIVVNWNSSFTSGIVSVKAVNACGMGSVRTLTVLGAPAMPVVISGPLNVCFGTTYRYSVSTVTGTSTYNWTAPGTIVAGQGTKDIDVLFSSVPATNLTVSVRTQNPCGLSSVRSLNGITLSSCIRFGSSEYDMLSVHPNPAQNQIEITYLTIPESHYRMEIFDAEGRQVWTDDGTGNGDLYTKKVEVGTIARGMYLLRVLDEHGVHQQRIVLN